MDWKTRTDKVAPKISRFHVYGFFLVELFEIESLCRWTTQFTGAGNRIEVEISKVIPEVIFQCTRGMVVVFLVKRLVNDILNILFNCYILFQ